jgi:hypothetical protein
MAGTAVIAMHEPWIDDEGADVLAEAATVGFLIRNRGDVLLMLLVVVSAVAAGLVARVLCGV